MENSHFIFFLHRLCEFNKKYVFNLSLHTETLKENILQGHKQLQRKGQSASGYLAYSFLWSAAPEISTSQTF